MKRKKIVPWLVLTGVILGTLFMFFAVDRNESAGLAFYVDIQNGNDANDGLSVTSAFQTIERAKEEVKTVNSNMTEDISVLIRGGEYVLSSAIQFSSEDSGSNGFYVNYQAYEDEDVILSGGRYITDWSLEDEARNVYCAYVGTETFRQIYVNGEATALARTPNLEDTKTGGPYYQALNKDYPFQIDAALADDITVGETEFVYIEHWNYMIAQISDISIENDRASLRFKQPQDEMAQTENSQKVTYYFLQNAKEYLDAPGEWYHDAQSGYLYYIPRDGEDMEYAEVVVPVTETLIDVTGNSSEDPANHITFCGLNFMYTNWTFPSSYGWFCTQQGQYPLYSMGHAGLVPGMVNLKYTSDIVLADNVFKNSGGCGIVSQPTSSHNIIDGNYFYNIASNAISLGVHGTYTSDTEILNNGFEKGDFSYWDTASDCVLIDSEGKNGNFERKSGNYSALLQGTEKGSCLIRNIDVSPETEYVCSFWHYGETALQCSVLTEDGTVIAQGVTEPGRDWSGFGLQFESGNNSRLLIVIENMSGTDVAVDDFNYDILEHYTEPYGGSSNDTVSNNYIENCASVYRDGCGIFALHPQYLKVIHNEICDMPYDGIGLGWAWDEDLTDSYGFSRNTHDNEIAYNRIYEVVQLLDDGAGVYILGRNDNTVVHHNYISDIGHSNYSGWNPVGGIYFDNGSVNKTAEYNVLKDVTYPFYAYNAPNHDNIIRNNYYTGGIGQIIASNTVIDNVKVDEEWPEEALEIMEAAGIEEGKNIRIPEA